MSRLTQSRATDFILLNGDNFYWDGVTSVDDPRFNQTFESTFRNDLPGFSDMEFFVVGGNHDYRGNMTAQIEYTNVQNRWKMPGLWYKINKTFGDFSVDILMLDTNCLHESGYEERKVEHLKWIEDELVASTADYLIVAGHHPIWSTAEQSRI